MSPRTSSSSDPDPEVTPEVEGEPVEATRATDDIPLAQRQMNEAMAANPPEEAPTTVYPPGSDALTAENVRRYPELFTDEQKATISSEELPESDVEKAQREQAEAADAADAADAETA